MASVANDVIQEQVEFTYDRGGNLIQTVTRQRYHNAPDTQTGPLDDPGTAPKARVTVRTMYPDSLGRTVATVEYGTNGGGTFTRPDTIPARSDSVLVRSTSFDAAGNVAETVDPSGMVTQYEYDDAGRKTVVIENVSGGGSSSSSSSSSEDGCDPSDDAKKPRASSSGPSKDGGVGVRQPGLGAWRLFDRRPCDHRRRSGSRSAGSGHRPDSRA